VETYQIESSLHGRKTDSKRFPQKDDTKTTRTITFTKMNQLFIQLLQDRFENNPHRHPDIKWSDVEKKLQNSEKLTILERMESTGGEVDVIGLDTETQEYIFMDCSRESPTGRRSLCYDQVALDTRKENKPS